MRLAPEITPFPAAQILLAGLRPLAVQQVQRAAKIVSGKLLLGDVHIRGVGALARGEFGGLGLLPKTGLIRARRVGLLPLLGFFGLCRNRQCLRCQCLAFGVLGSHRLPSRGDDAQKKGPEDDGSGGKRDFVPANRLLDPVSRRGRTRHHRLVVQVSFEIRRQTGRSIVTPGPVLLQTLHHNPIQIPLELVDQFRLVRRTSFRRRRQIFTFERRKARARSHRLLLADGFPHGVNAQRHQLIRIKGRTPSQQLVEQYAEGINVRARINIQSAHLCLFR